MKRIAFFITTAFCLFSVAGISAVVRTPPEIEWEFFERGEGSAYCNSVKQTADGGFIAAGWTSDGLQRDAFLVKVDSSGVLDWKQTYGGAGENVFCDLYSTYEGGVS